MNVESAAAPAERRLIKYAGETEFSTERQRVSPKQREGEKERAFGGREIIESLTETRPSVGDRENPSREICHPLYDRRRARVKGVTHTESFVRNTDPPLTYLRTPTYTRARAHIIRLFA